MGAYKFNLSVHDDEAEAFVREALTSDWSTLDADELAIIQDKARYIAQRMVDSCPELAPGEHAIDYDGLQRVIGSAKLPPLRITDR